MTRAGRSAGRDDTGMSVSVRVITVGGEEGARLRAAQGAAMRDFLLCVQQQRAAARGRGVQDRLPDHRRAGRGRLIHD